MSALDADAWTMPIPFVRLMRVELRKAIDTRASRVLLGCFVGSGVLLLVLTMALTDAPSIEVAALPALLTSLALPVVGALLMTSEWSRRTASTTFWLVPRRWPVLVAKVAAGLVLAGGAVVVLLTGFIAVTGVAIVARGASIDWTLLVEPGELVAIAAFSGMLLGLAWGALLMSTSAAIVVVLALPLVVDLIVLALAGDAGPWLVSGTFGNWLLGEAPVGAGLTSLLIWYVAPLLIGVWLQNRREVR